MEKRDFLYMWASTESESAYHLPPPKNLHWSKIGKIFLRIGKSSTKTRRWQKSVACLKITMGVERKKFENWEKFGSTV